MSGVALILFVFFRLSSNWHPVPPPGSASASQGLFDRQVCGTQYSLVFLCFALLFEEGLQRQLRGILDLYNRGTYYYKTLPSSVVFKVRHSSQTHRPCLRCGTKIFCLCLHNGLLALIRQFGVIHQLSPSSCTTAVWSRLSHLDKKQQVLS